jgi:signal transduction histidine kinase
VEALAELFETNRIIVLTVYGEVFFVLGLAIALQSLKRSTLALARPLPWLAAFGIVHGFHEWGYLFIPIQSGYLPLSVTEGLLILQLLMKGVSFALLLQFGVELVAAMTRLPILPRLRLLPAAALLAWGGATLAVSALYPGYLPDPAAWLQEGQIDAALAAVGAPLAVGDALARWMMALPGAALAAWGLMASARSVAAIARPSVLAGLQLAAVAFALYALVGGVIGQPAPFFPASVLNATTVREALGIPIEVLRSGAGLLIAVAIIVALDLFEQETDRALAAARRRELLARERERIGRDLHDGIIQSIYAAGLHLDEASVALDPAAEVPRARIRTVLGELERISNDIRATIFDLRGAGLETLDAEEIVRSVADELRANTLVELQLDVEGAWEPRLTPEQAAQLHQIVHEAFSNVLRHAKARRVGVRLACSKGSFQLEIRDDGAGFVPEVVTDASRAGSVHGLPNMRRRAELLNATLTVRSAPGRGTELSLTMPVATVRRPT